MAPCKFFVLVWSRIICSSYMKNILAIFILVILNLGFLSGSDGKACVCNAGDLGLIPGLGRSPGEGNGNPSPVSLPGKCYGAWWATVHGVAKSQT